jgi:hypothetical protein
MTLAFPVAKFTDAVTSSRALSFFSTRAAHAAHVIPWTDSSTCLNPGDDAWPVIAADIQPLPPSRTAQPACTTADNRGTGKSTPPPKRRQREKAHVNVTVITTR